LRQFLSWLSLVASCPIATMASGLRLFDTTTVEFGAHLAMPEGTLAATFSPSPTVRMGLETSYADGIRALGTLSYTPLDGTIPVHYLVASSGLDLLWPRGFSTAGALSLHYARTHKPQSPPLQLDGGESEFGLETRAAWTTGWTARWRQRFSLQASMVFTSPRPSLILWCGTDLSWTTPWHL